MKIGLHPGHGLAVLSLISVSAVLAWHLLITPARAEAVRQVTWDDLVPPQAPLVDPFDRLEMNDRVELGFIADMRRQRQLGFVDATDENVHMANDMAAKMTARGLDVENLLALDRDFRMQIEERGRAVVPALDGQMIRMPGYALPLEFSGKAIRRFLLVPYVGACIHTPPPPPNQLIVVDLETPYTVKDIYDPIWITGRLTAKSGSQSLSFIDGSADVRFGYALQGTEITPYEE